MEEDWLKLNRLIGYLHGTIDRALTIGVDSLSVMGIFVDASYVAHPNMRGHTRGCICFAREAIMSSKSVKQSLNTTSFTQSKLVDCSDYIPSAMYANKFLQAQGYRIDMSNVHQDNQSTI